METIWFGGILTHKVDRQAISSWMDWFSSLATRPFESKEQGIVLAHVAFTCWHIWKARCNFLFNQSPINPTQVLLAISTSTNVFLNVIDAQSHSPPPITMVEVPVAWWSPPPFPFLKVMVCIIPYVLRWGCHHR